MYQVELVWNGDYYFVPHGDLKDTIELAITHANDIKNSGDGVRVKKCRVVDEFGDVVWNG